MTDTHIKELKKICKELKKICKNYTKIIKVMEHEITVGRYKKAEKDEVLAILKLYNLNEENNYDELVIIFGDEASDGIQLICMETNTIITDITMIKKADSKFKADCIIKMKKTKYEYHISIKSKNWANPAILNHTPRSAKVFQPNGILHKYIESLDKMMEEYIYKGM